MCVVSGCVSQAKTRPPAMPRMDGKPAAKTADSANEKMWLTKMFTAAGELQEAASDMQTYARTNKSVSRKVGLYAADAAYRLLIRMSWRNPIDPTTRCEGMALQASDFYMKAVAEFEASGFLDPALRPGWLDTNDWSPWEEDPWLDDEREGTWDEDPWKSWEEDPWESASEAAATKGSSEERLLLPARRWQ